MDVAVAAMSKTVYDIDQAGNVICTYVDSEKEELQIVSFSTSSGSAYPIQPLLGIGSSFDDLIGI